MKLKDLTYLQALTVCDHFVLADTTGRASVHCEKCPFHCGDSCCMEQMFAEVDESLIK